MIILIILITLVISMPQNVYATSVSKDLNLSNYLDTLKSESNIDTFELYESLINEEKVDYEKITAKVIDTLIGQLKTTIKSVAALLLIVILTSVISAIELDKNSDVIKICKLVIIVSVLGVVIKNYIEILDVLKNVIGTISYLMQVVSIFLTGVLVATGAIATTGTTITIILFVSNALVSVLNYIIIPLFNISITIAIISRIGENVRLDKFANLFRKTSMYIYTSGISIFVLVLSLENTISKSINNIYFKTTQNIVADAVPVVGKFLSDSLETVLGATELVGKVGGTIAIICTISIVIIPVIKIGIIFGLYKLLAAICEPINEEKEVSQIIEYFADIYKCMLGIIIGTMVMFLCTTGIIMSTISKIT